MLAESGLECLCLFCTSETVPLMSYSVVCVDHHSVQSVNRGTSSLLWPNIVLLSQVLKRESSSALQDSCWITFWWQVWDLVDSFIIFFKCERFRFAGNMLTVQLQDCRISSARLSRLWLRLCVCQHCGFVWRCYRLSIWFFSVIKWLMMWDWKETSSLLRLPPTDVLILSDLWVRPLEEWSFIERGTRTSRSCFWDFKGSKNTMFSCGPELWAWVIRVLTDEDWSSSVCVCLHLFMNQQRCCVQSSVTTRQPSPALTQAQDCSLCCLHHSCTEIHVAFIFLLHTYQHICYSAAPCSTSGPDDLLCRVWTVIVIFGCLFLWKFSRPKVMPCRLELWNVHLCNSPATLAASGIWISFERPLRKSLLILVIQRTQESSSTLFPQVNVCYYLGGFLGKIR